MLWFVGVYSLLQFQLQTGQTLAHLIYNSIPLISGEMMDFEACPLSHLKIGIIIYLNLCIILTVRILNFTILDSKYTVKIESPLLASEQSKRDTI